MNAYNVALFIHILGVITFFLAVGISQRGGAQVRRAQTVEHLRLWLGLVKTTEGMFPAAILLLLATGLYMTADVWDFETPWVVVGLFTLAALMAVGIAVVGRRFTRMAEAATTAGEGAVPADLRKLIAEPVTWVGLSANNGAAIGVVWLMTNKPGWTASILIVLGLALVGAFIGFAIARRAVQTAGAP
jgi:hypothetical protein